ncbi:heterokaryon incompatibility protein-domain-containing protein [Paraphoma chrysanthemicola]|nr:heterokaryon incompatibility protein-domain-containing protein [Paraphoma chrysanthemicola]
MAAATKGSPGEWWIEGPEAVPEDNPSFLCDVCKHINFQYLIFKIPIQFVSDEIPLDSYSTILEKQHCAFCRLIKYTIDNLYGTNALPTEHEGKAIMISMIVKVAKPTLDNKSASDPRQLLLWVKPDPLCKGGTTPLEIHHVVEGGWFDSDGKGRLIPSQMVFLLPLYWNRSCRNSLSSLHKDVPAETDHYDLPTNFRLIDTEKMCIVPAESSFEYIALSYTWGKSKQFKLFKDNYQELSKENALLEFEHQIPQTIKDAIFLVKTLGDRYLWVDALCIMQDPECDDKKIQLPYMDRIYSSSVLTIAATYGNGADAGLPGVRPNSRKRMQRVESIQGIRLANRPWSFDKSVTESTWNTRAWTFQERVLSSRMLFITEQQIFFKCDHVAGVLAEDLDSKLSKRIPITHAMDDTGTDRIPQQWSVNILSYLRTVESFTARELTFPGDVLDAFSGIAQRMRTFFRSGFLYGLPQSELDYCLLWEPAGHIRRRCTQPDKEEGEPLFPSWSWAGWTGPARYIWEERLSRIKWVDHASGTLLSSDDYRSPVPSTSTKGHSNTDWRKAWIEQKTRSGFRYFYHKSKPDIWFRHPTASEAERSGRIGPECMTGTQHLRFWASTHDIQFTGEYIPPQNVKEPFWQFNLTDSKGFATGYFTVPVVLLPKLDFKNKEYDMVLICRTRIAYSREEIEAKKAGSEPPAVYSSGDTMKRDKALEDYVDADDVTMETANFDELPSAQEAKWGLCFDRQRYDAFKPFCLYEFLVVEWNEGVASRIGIGKIHIDAWAQEHPKEKLITLG